MAKYEVLILGKRDNLSVIFPDPAMRGHAVSSDTMDGKEQITALLAQPDNPDFLGHLARNINVQGGPTVEDQLFGGRLEATDKAGRETSVEDVEVFSAEGDMLFAGANAIAANTPLHTPITFEDGLPRVAQVGEYAFYTLIGKPDPVEGSALRCTFKRVQTFKVAA